jgi:tetratricopeptide (TPR) repeat protein
LHQTIDVLLRENPTVGREIAELWFLLALCERNPSAVARVLAAIPPEGINENGTTFPRAWSEGLAARVLGDTATATGAFLAARDELAQIIKDQPNYARALAVLGMTDAALGHRDDALLESRRAVELLPVSQDAINGASQLRYLAISYTWLGEKDLAIAELQKAASSPSDVTYGQLRLHPYWDPLRGDPRFEKIVASLAPKD